MGAGEFTAGGNPAIDQHPIQGGVASCYRNRDKLRRDGSLGSHHRLYLPSTGPEEDYGRFPFTKKCENFPLEISVREERVPFDTSPIRSQAPFCCLLGPPLGSDISLFFNFGSFCMYFEFFTFSFLFLFFFYRKCFYHFAMILSISSTVLTITETQRLPSTYFTYGHDP